MRVAIFASGNGTNFEILAQQFQNHDLPGDLVMLFCDHPTAHVIDRAKRLKVPYETFTVKECGGKPAYEKRILKVLQDYQIDFIALAGYMRVVGPTIGSLWGFDRQPPPGLLAGLPGVAFNRTGLYRSPNTNRGHHPLHRLRAGLGPNHCPRARGNQAR